MILVKANEDGVQEIHIRHCDVGVIRNRILSAIFASYAPFTGRLSDAPHRIEHIIADEDHLEGNEVRIKAIDWASEKVRMLWPSEARAADIERFEYTTGSGRTLEFRPREIVCHLGGSHNFADSLLRTILNVDELPEHLLEHTWRFQAATGPSTFRGDPVDVEFCMGKPKATKASMLGVPPWLIEVDYRIAPMSDDAFDAKYSAENAVEYQDFFKPEAGQ